LEKDEACMKSIFEVVDIFHSKWSFLIINELCSGTKRFNQLRRLLNISTKSLTDILRHLELHGIISRNVFPTVPVTVEYALTEKGLDFDTVIAAMRDWRTRWL